MGDCWTERLKFTTDYHELNSIGEKSLSILIEYRKVLQDSLPRTEGWLVNYDNIGYYSSIHPSAGLNPSVLAFGHTNSPNTEEIFLRQ